MFMGIRRCIMEKVQNIFEADLQEKNQFLEDQSKCPLCKGHLNICVEMIPSTHVVREEARCIECMALSRVGNHIIH